MRELKFRAIMNEKGHFGHEGNWVYLNGIGHGFWFSKNGRYYGEIKPNTVEQYIFVKDKNGNEIYEGNIVRGERVTLSCGDETREELESRKPEYGIGYIKWDERELGWEIVAPCPESKYVKEGLMRLYLGTLEIIGDIHENPDYLKTGEL